MMRCFIFGLDFIIFFDKKNCAPYWPSKIFVEKNVLYFCKILSLLPPYARKRFYIVFKNKINTS